MFVSTKMDWWQKTRPEFADLLNDRLATLGLEMISANQPYLLKGSGTQLTSTAHKEIQRASALILILPQFPGWKTGVGVQWLVFELAIAIERRMPTAICLDIRKQADRRKWLAAIQQIENVPVFEFDGGKGDQQILAAIDPALTRIAETFLDK